MLRISLNGSRIISVDQDPETFRTTWAASALNNALMDLQSTEGRVLVPCRSVTLIEVV